MATEPVCWSVLIALKLEHFGHFIVASYMLALDECG